MTQLMHSDITGEVIGAACEVWSVLGYGFLERVYENSLATELRLRGVSADQQTEIGVSYKGVVVGHYIVDMFVGSKVIVELKADKEISSKHEAQILNYLKATGIRVGMLVNFGERRCEWKRLVV